MSNSLVPADNVMNPVSMNGATKDSIVYVVNYGMYGRIAYIDNTLMENVCVDLFFSNNRVHVLGCMIEPVTKAFYELQMNRLQDSLRDLEYSYKLSLDDGEMHTV